MAVGDNTTESPSLEIESAGAESHVIDDAQYSHKRRLQAIHNAQDRVMDVRNAVEERLIEGAISEYHARRYYRGAVESLIMEVLSLLQDDEVRLDKDYAQQVEIGKVRVDPPEELVDFARSNVDRMPPGGSVPSTYETTIHGLKTILDLPSPITRQFSVAVHTGGSVQTLARTVETELSRRLLDSAVNLTSEALGEAQMGLNIGEGRPRNRLGGGDRADPWSSDAVLPHEIRDAVENGDLDAEALEAVLEGEDAR